MLWGTGALGAAGLLGTGAGVLASTRHGADPRAVISLWSQTVAFDRDGDRVLVGGSGSTAALTSGAAPGTPVARGGGGVPTAALQPGTRLVRTVDPTGPVARSAEEYMAAAADWLAQVPAELRDLASTALLDLWVLSESLPAPVAGWSGSWRYVWPRDAAFCAVAFARVGLMDRARATLQHLASLQDTDGWFEARYDLATGRRPDRRTRQFDGTGLLLWAVGEVLDVVAPAERAEHAASLTGLIQRSGSLLLQATGKGCSLPPAGPDYWELPEKQVTLWTMATVLRGLRTAGELTEEQAFVDAAQSFTTLLRGSFGAHGYQRYRTGGGADSALALFEATGMGDVVPPRQLRSLRSELARPGGGIAPGASWRKDGVSWTPSTSLLALGLARSGELGQALAVLRWLSDHRTDAGSLPEKVLFDGRPAEVAPLAWTAATVLLAIDAL